MITLDIAYKAFSLQFCGFETGCLNNQMSNTHSMFFNKCADTRMKSRWMNSSCVSDVLPCQTQWSTLPDSTSKICILVWVTTANPSLDQQTDAILWLSCSRLCLSSNSRPSSGNDQTFTQYFPPASRHIVCLNVLSAMTSHCLIRDPLHQWIRHLTLKKGCLIRESLSWCTYLRSKVTSISRNASLIQGLIVI